MSSLLSGAAMPRNAPTAVGGGRATGVHDDPRVGQPDDARALVQDDGARGARAELPGPGDVRTSAQLVGKAGEAVPPGKQGGYGGGDAPGPAALGGIHVAPP